MVGVRMMGKIFDNFDFTLNYMFKRVDPYAVFDLPSFFGTDHDDGLGRVDQYGRRLGSFSNTLLGSEGGFFAHDPTNPNNMLNFRRALDRCFEENKATFFQNVDSYGYSQDGNPDNDRGRDRVFRGGPRVSVDECVWLHGHL